MIKRIDLGLFNCEVENSNMKSKKIYVFILIFLIIFILIFNLFENRYFFQFNNKWFTVWNTKDGCYLILNKYRGLRIPHDNYALIDSRIDIKIFVDEENSYHLFSDNTYYDGYIPAAKFSDVSFVVHPYATRELNYKEMEFYEQADFPYFEYECLNNWGHVKDDASDVHEVLTYDAKWILQRFLLGIFWFNRDKKNNQGMKN
jgi:hypothetical protein